MKSCTTFAAFTALLASTTATRFTVSPSEDFDKVCFEDPNFGPGDDCYLLKGDHEYDGLTQKHGTPDQRITIHGESGACIRGSGTRDRVLQLAHSFYTVKDLCFNGQHGSNYAATAIYVLGGDLAVEKGESFGIKSGVTGTQLFDLEIKNFDSECIHLRYFVTFTEVRGCTIQYCGRSDFENGGGGKVGEAIYVGTALDQISDGKAPEVQLYSGAPDDGNIDVTQKNWIHQNTMRTYGNECVDCKEGSTNNLIENNVCEQQKDPNSGCFGSRGSGNTFRYNEIANCVGAGVRVGGGDDFGTDNNIYDNTISDADYGAFNVMASPQGKVCGNKISTTAVTTQGAEKSYFVTDVVTGSCNTGDTPGDISEFGTTPSGGGSTSASGDDGIDTTYGGEITPAPTTTTDSESAPASEKDDDDTPYGGERTPAPTATDVDGDTTYGGGSTAASEDDGSGTTYGGGSTAASGDDGSGTTYVGGSTAASEDDDDITYGGGSTAASEDDGSGTTYGGGSTAASEDDGSGVTYGGGSTAASEDDGSGTTYVGGSTAASEDDGSGTTYGGGSTAASEDDGSGTTYGGGSTAASEDDGSGTTYGGGSTPASGDDGSGTTYGGGSMPASEDDDDTTYGGGSTPASEDDVDDTTTYGGDDDDEEDGDKAVPFDEEGKDANLCAGVNCVDQDEIKAIPDEDKTVEVMTNSNAGRSGLGGCGTVVPVVKLKAEHYKDRDTVTSVGNLFDGDVDTYFSVNRESTFHILELEQETVVHGVSIGFFMKAASEERIQTFHVAVRSYDETEYTTMISHKESSGKMGDVQHFEFTSPVKAQYIKIESHGNSFNNWTAFTEVEVCGLAAEPNALFSGVRAAKSEIAELAGEVCTNNLKMLAPVWVKGTGNGNIKDCFDNNFGSRWSTEDTQELNDLDNGKVMLRFEGDVHVSRVNIAFFDGSLSRQHFSLYGQSASERTWSSILDNEIVSKTELMQTFDIQKTGVNTLSIVGHGNDVGVLTKISEIKVWGC